MQERHAAKTVGEIKQFVSKLPHMQAAKQSLATRTCNMLFKLGVKKFRIRILLYLFRITDADSDSDSNPIPVLCIWDENLNLTPCSVERSTYYNVVIWFSVQIVIRIGIRIKQCK